jgi:hypothetical protein
MIESPALERRIGQPIASIRRAPYPYRTRHKIEQLEMVLADDATLEMLVIDLWS